MRARYVCLATGPLNRPKLPGIPGIESFEGHSFHASRWDYAYTGGDSRGGLVGLRGKRVGIIGTGATSVQCVPHVGEWAEHLYVFQRTPSSIDVKNSPPTDPEWAKLARARLAPGSAWTTSTTSCRACRSRSTWCKDGWTDLIGKLLLGIAQGRSTRLHARGHRARGRARRLREDGGDPRARGRDGEGCRRPPRRSSPTTGSSASGPCVHNEYLETFNRPNVTLVDTSGRGVERITAKGVVVDGREYPVDCLIYASGFEVGTDYCRRAGPRDPRPRRPEPARDVGERRAHAARHARPRLPELLHHEQRAGRLHGELSRTC